MRIKIYPYKQGSASARMLANVLNGRVLKLTGSSYVPKSSDIVINWGSSSCPDFGPATTLNVNVNTAQCKLAAFKALSEAGVSIPKFWESQSDIPVENYPVVARTILRGHSGNGIVMLSGNQDQVNAPLYTQYVKKKDEYRVHVFKEKPFFVQRKARKSSVETPNWQIRNLAGGFVFVEQDIASVPASVLTEAVAAIKAVGVDFGGVDIIWNENQKKAYALEINSACGLEERTALKYKEAFYEELHP